MFVGNTFLALWELCALVNKRIQHFVQWLFTTNEPMKELIVG